MEGEDQVNEEGRTETLTSPLVEEEAVYSGRIDLSQGRSSSAVGYRGVTKTQGGRFMASIGIPPKNNRSRHLGTFDSAE